jgi:CHASE1-domain containing sensor protein
MRRWIGVMIAAQIMLYGMLAVYAALGATAYRTAFDHTADLAAFVPAEPPVSRLAGLAP